MSNLKATKRENISSGSNNKLRANGYIPAILYGGKNKNEKIGDKGRGSYNFHGKNGLNAGLTLAVYFSALK